jgi:hypothetical protein
MSAKLILITESKSWQRGAGNRQLRRKSPQVAECNYDQG